MKKILLLCILFTSMISRAQKETSALNYQGNKFELSSERTDTGKVIIYLTNISDNNTVKRIEFTGNEVVADFSAKLSEEVKTMAGTTLSLPEDVTITPPGDSHDDIVTAISGLGADEFKKLLALKFQYTNTNKTFSEYFLIRDHGDKTVLFTNSDKYILINNSGTKELNDGTNNFTVNSSDENSLLTSLQERYGNDKAFIKEIVFTKKEYGALYTQKLSVFFDEYYKKVFEKDDYKFVGNIEATGSTLNVYIKPNNKDKYFNLRICRGTPADCKILETIPFDINEPQFVKKMHTFINTNFQVDGAVVPEAELIKLHNKCRTYAEKAVVAEVATQFQDTISSLIKKIENLAPQYSGVLKLNTSARVYEMKKKSGFGRFFCCRKERDVKPVDNLTFEPKYSTVRFFNNKAKEIVIVGKLKDNTNEFVTINVWYSIPLRAFNNSKQYIPISPNDNDAEGYYLNYNDLFQYYPSGQTYSYSARNSDYRIKAGDSVRIEQRRLADYFTAVIFSDFLGLNSNNANSLLQAEGRAKIPLWISNKCEYSIITALRADINVTIYNGFDDTSRFITPLNTNKGVADEELTYLRIDYFDYIKFNNVNAGIGLDIFNWEWKGLSTEWSLGYGLRYYRAGAKYFIKNTTDESDIEKRYQLNALTHEVWTNFEIRPQINFGADVNVGFNWLNGSGSTDNVPVLYSKNRNNDDKSVLKVMVNLYSKLDPDSSNDGIYARLGGFYHLGQKDFFPQIMVGYATNLSSFVNKFKKG